MQNRHYPSQLIIEDMESLFLISWPLVLFSWACVYTTLYISRSCQYLSTAVHSLDIYYVHCISHSFVEANAGMGTLYMYIP